MVLQTANDSVMEWADAGLKENSIYKFTKKDSSYISYRFLMVTRRYLQKHFL